MKQRPGDQPLPTKNDLPRCHDMVCDRLKVRYEGPTADRLMDAVQGRLALGLERYGAALQPRNGRDFLRDLAEEQQDALAYGVGLEYELREDDPENWIYLIEHLKRLMDFAMFVQHLRVKREERHGLLSTAHPSQGADAHAG